MKNINFVLKTLKFLKNIIILFPQILNLGDDCSYSSEYDNSDNYKSNQYSDENGCDLDFTPTTILNPHGTSDRSKFNQILS